MAITPGYKTEDVEEEYIDKGAVTTPQVNPEVDRKYMEGRAQADATDKVEWPTVIAGQTTEFN
jgi:hypothetical protein